MSGGSLLVDLQAGRRRYLVENLADQGLSISEIAEQLGLSKKAVRRRVRAWRRKNQREREAIRAYAAWCLNAAREIPELVRRSQAAARRVRAYGGEVEGHVDLLAVIERDKAICHICDEPVEPRDLAFDHVVPVLHGGGHTVENVRVAHSRCNSAKGARL